MKVAIIQLAMNNCEGRRVFSLLTKEGGGLVVYDFELSDDIVIICVAFCRLRICRS